MNCEHVRLGSSEISNTGLCGFCWKERAEKAEATLDRYAIEHPTICYQCGQPDKARVLVEALEFVQANTAHNEPICDCIVCKALAQLMDTQ